MAAIRNSGCVTKCRLPCAHDNTSADGHTPGTCKAVQKQNSHTARHRGFKIVPTQWCWTVQQPLLTEWAQQNRDRNNRNQQLRKSLSSSLTIGTQFHSSAHSQLCTCSSQHWGQCPECCSFMCPSTDRAQSSAQSREWEASCVTARKHKCFHYTLYLLSLCCAS